MFYCSNGLQTGRVGDQAQRRTPVVQFTTSDRQESVPKSTIYKSVFCFQKNYLPSKEGHLYGCRALVVACPALSVGAATSVTIHIRSKWLIRCIRMSAATVENALLLFDNTRITLGNKWPMSVHLPLPFGLRPTPFITSDNSVIVVESKA